MKLELINKILADTAYVRMGGREEEKKAAEYLVGVCNQFTKGAYLEEFPVDLGDIKRAKLYADGKEIECKAYFLCGSGIAEGELYYLRSTDKYSLSQCRGKIVMIDTYLGFGDTAILSKTARSRLSPLTETSTMPITISTSASFVPT